MQREMRSTQHIHNYKYTIYIASCMLSLSLHALSLTHTRIFANVSAVSWCIPVHDWICACGGILRSLYFDIDYE